MLRTALLSLAALCLLLVASSAFAYAPSQVCSYTWNTNYGSGTAPTLAEAVAAMAASQTGANPQMSYVGLHPGNQTLYCSPNCQTNYVPVCGGSNGSNNGYGVFYNSAAQWTGVPSSNTMVSAQSPAPGCPNGGTLSGGQCVCPAGYSDTGTGCVQDTCPAAGTDVGLVNVTNGYALSATPGANDVVIDYGGDVYKPAQCRSTSSGWCSVTPDLTRMNQVKVWRSQTPTAQGLYRLSTDVPMTSAGGAACTPSSNDSTHPDKTPPTCPTGNVGTVNGKAVCLGTMPAQGINLGASEKGGNPRAGTGSTDTNATREPDAAQGGAPDARGGPGVTRAPDGGVGTGSNRTEGVAGQGSASPTVKVQLDLPTDYNREATQQQINSKLGQVVEGLQGDGMPTGPNQATQDARDRIARGGPGGGDSGPIFPGDDAIKGVVQADSALQSKRQATDSKVSSSLNFSESCTPWEIGQLTIDPCGAPADWLRLALAWVYGLGGLVYLYRRSGDVLTGDA